MTQFPNDEGAGGANNPVREDLGVSPDGAGLLPAVEPVPVSPANAAAIPDAVEPKVLIFADDPERNPRLYACPKCGSVHSPEIYLATEERKHAAARNAASDCYSCKTHGNCKYCGAECHKSFTACEGCRYRRKIDAAIEIEDDGGPYFAFGEDEMMWDICEAQDRGLEWVCPTTEVYPRLDADHILESLVEEMYEDASVDDLEGVHAFCKAVERFNKAQKTRTYWADEKRKIRVSARDSDASLAEDGLPAEPRSGGSAGRKASPNLPLIEEMKG